MKGLYRYVHGGQSPRQIVGMHDLRPRQTDKMPVSMVVRIQGITCAHPVRSIRQPPMKRSAGVANRLAQGALVCTPLQLVKKIDHSHIRSESVAPKDYVSERA